MAQKMDTSDYPMTATTISTVAVQSGKAKIILAILRSNDWVRVRIQQMEPDLMDAGASLDEARRLRDQHNDLLVKLQQKQADVIKLLQQADEAVIADLERQGASEDQQQMLYSAMTESLSEAWKDLTSQLELRKLLLEQSIAFHSAANSFSAQMQSAQSRFNNVGIAHDIETARSLLDQHQNFKKGILESSMNTLQEGQSLLYRIREMGMHADVQSRHATTAACYGIEHLLELLQDRRRQLDELWLQRKIQLEQCLQMLLLDKEVHKISEWFTSVGDQYLSITDLGTDYASAAQLQQKHYQFEMQAKEMEETVLRLIRTADQLVHSSHYDAEGVQRRLKQVDLQSESFMLKMDDRRRNLAMATSFFSQAKSTLGKLAEIERQVNMDDSSTMADAYHVISTAVVEATSSALHDGRALLERTGRGDSGCKGIIDMLEIIETRAHDLLKSCESKFDTSSKSPQYYEFQDKYTELYTWLIRIVQTMLEQESQLGDNLTSSKDFLDAHERLYDDMQSKQCDVERIIRLSNDLQEQGSSDIVADDVDRKVSTLRDQWNSLHDSVERRVHLSLVYVAFHKTAMQLSQKMDALEQFVKIEKVDPSTITDGSVKHKEETWQEMNKGYNDVESSGKSFVNNAAELNERWLDTPHAVRVVETTISRLSQRRRLLSDYYENWRVHVTSGREFKSQWHQFIQDARKTIDNIMCKEDDFFPAIAAELGSSASNTNEYRKKLEEFRPFVRKAQEEIECHLRTAEKLSLKGDSHGEKEKIVNELLKVHSRLSARINEYNILLNMTSRFFEQLNKLDELISMTEKQYKATPLPNDVAHAEIMLQQHENNRLKVLKQIDFVADDGETIVKRVRQQDSEATAKDEVQNVLQLTENRRETWERAWEAQRRKLEQNLHICQFYFDLKTLHSELDELHRQLEAKKGNYGTSLSSVKTISEAFKAFELTTELVKKKLDNFEQASKEEISSIDDADCGQIEREIDSLKRKWQAFWDAVQMYRRALDIAEDFFNEMEECEEFIKTIYDVSSKIRRDAVKCTTSQDVALLLKNLDNFRRDGCNKQNERLSNMDDRINIVFGSRGQSRLKNIVDRNNEAVNHLSRVVDELSEINDHLVKKEQLVSVMEQVVDAPKTAKPKITSPLQNAQVTEGQRVVMECHIQSDVIPKIEWYKDNILISSPDYQPHFQNGRATLTIDETFPDDSANYTCKALTPTGSAETSANLFVKETHRKVEPPEFTRQLRSVCEVPEGTQHVLECHVTGIPTPNISWMKNSDCIDDEPEFVITKINGTCCLKIRRTAQEHSAKYTCFATNNGGSASSSSTVRVFPVEKPIIRKQLPNVAAVEGNPVKLKMDFSGKPPPQVTWLKGDKPIHNSHVHKVTVAEHQTTLEIVRLTPAECGTYTVVLKNLGGETRSSCLVSLSSGSIPSDIDHQKPQVLESLRNVDSKLGQTVFLECVIAGATECEITWYHQNRPIRENNRIKFLFDGDKCCLRISSLKNEDYGSYRCTATNLLGTDKTQCAVIPPVRSPDQAEPPHFTLLLKDLEDYEGEMVRFECCVNAYPNPTIKWFRNGKPIEHSSDFQISNINELQILTIPEAFREDGGNFCCEAKNVAGEAKCYATLIVKPMSEKHVMKTRLLETSQTVKKTLVGDHLQKPPELIRPFKDFKARPGKPCKMEAEVSGNPEPTVTWYFNDEPIVSPDYQISRIGNVHTLYIPEVFDEDAGRFSLIAENSNGKATCTALLVVVQDTEIDDITDNVPARERMTVPTVAQKRALSPKQFSPVVGSPRGPSPRDLGREYQQVDLTMEVPVPPNFLRELKNIVAMEGTRVKFEAAVDGKPNPTIKWFKEGKELNDSADFEISYRNGRVELTIPEVFCEDAGKFDCIASNKAGTKTSSAELIVKASLIPPSFIDRLQSSEVREGDKVAMTVKVAGNPTPEISWYREATKIVSSADFEIKTAGNMSSLYIPEVFYEDSGKFTVVAENEAGIERCTAELIVEAPSAIEESASPSPPRSPSIGQSPMRFAAPSAAPPKIPEPPSAPPMFKPTKPVQFLKPLSDTKVKEGQRCTLECIVPSATRPDKIQWFRNEVEIHPSLDYNIRYDQGKCSLTIIEVFVEDAGIYKCSITVEGLTNSTTMVLDIEAIPQPPPPPPPPKPVSSPVQPHRAPFFQNKMPHQQLATGGSSYFEVKVIGHPPPIISWTRMGHPIVDKVRFDSTYDQYKGITTLTIKNLNASDEGEYTCTAENAAGASSTSAWLLGPDRYKLWREQGIHPSKMPERIPESYKPEERISTETAVPLRTPQDFVVSDFESRLKKDVAERDRMDGQASIPKFEKVLENKQTPEGGEVSLTCKVNGVPLPNIDWYHNGRLIRPSRRYEMKMSKEGLITLNMRMALPEDTGYYTCCATNLAGRDTCSAELNVGPISVIDESSYVAPETLKRMMKSPQEIKDRGSGGILEKHFKPIFRKIPMDQQVPEGKMVRFDCVLSGRPIPELFWYLEGKQVHDDDIHKIVVNEDGIHSLIINSTSPSDAGQYLCIARNRAGEDQFNVHLNVQSQGEICPPRFIERMSAMQVKEGEPVCLTAESIGNPTPMMSWQKDGRHINMDDMRYRIETNEGRSSLHIPEATAQDNAWFQCTAANCTGTATNRARLIVQIETKKKKVPTATLR